MSYKNRIHASKERLEAALMEDARRFGHHGVANLVEIARQREHAAITEDYARELLARVGYKEPKP